MACCPHHHKGTTLSFVFFGYVHNWLIAFVILHVVQELSMVENGYSVQIMHEEPLGHPIGSCPGFRFLCWALHSSTAVSFRSTWPAAPGNLTSRHGASANAVAVPMPFDLPLSTVPMTSRPSIEMDAESSHPYDSSHRFTWYTRRSRLPHRTRLYGHERILRRPQRH